MEKKHQIFLSYSRRDSAMMFRIRDTLTLSGMVVWTDERLTAGTPSWKDAIETAIRDASCIVVVLSPDAKGSVWIERELDYARLLEKRIFPVVVRGTSVEAIPFELVNVQYVSARDNFDSAMQQLVLALRDHLKLEKNAPIGIASPAAVVGGQAVYTEAGDSEHTRWVLWRRRLRLLSWFFLDPHKFLAYKRLGGKKTADEFSAWVLSTMLWVALLVPVIFLVYPTPAFPLTMIVPVLGVTFLFCWGVTVWLGARVEGILALVNALLKLIVIILTCGVVVGAIVLGYANNVARSIIR